MHPRLRRLGSRFPPALALGLATAILAGGVAQFVWRVSALRALRATGPNWSFPSRVFSNGVPLVPGRAASEAYLGAELAARDYREVTAPAVTPGTYARGAGVLEIVLRGFPDEPDPEGSGGPERVSVRIAEGRIVAVRREGAVPGSMPPDLAHPPRLEPVLVSMIFDDERMWRSWVSLERVPKAVRAAIIASEDRRFYRHGGFDPRGAARALTVNLRSHGVRQGGSTITQQLARGLFLGRKRTVARKLAEVPLSFGLEVMLSKDQILEMYLNSVYWGQAQGFSIGGIAQAAQWYFAAPIESLDVLEGATLAAMIPAPNALDPFENPERVRERRNTVLNDMVETHDLPAATAATLAARPLGLRRGRTPVERFPSYSGYVQAHLDHVLRRRAARHQGWSVFTSMDVAWQAQAEEEIERGLEGLDASSGRRRRLEGAFVALDPATSTVVAMVGGRAMETGDFNRAWQARRQTGSAIKPIVYAAALASPVGITPATTLPDTQRVFGRGRWAWKPRNYDGSYHDEVTVAKALEKSLNVATTNLVDMIGPNQVADAAERFGLGRLKPVMSIGLGSNEVSLVELTAAFVAFGSRGMVRRPSPIRVVADHARHPLLTASESATDAIPAGIASLMTGLLENVVRYGVASPLRSVYGFDRPVAGKTGTTDDFKDAWFVGFTPDVVAGVWVGYDRPRSIGRQAAHTALPLWARAVGRMLDGFPPTPFPTDGELEWVDIDPWTGCLADSLTPIEKVPFLYGTHPLASCHPFAYEYLYEAADTSWRDTSWTATRDTLEREQPEPPEEPAIEPAEPEPPDVETDSLTDSTETQRPR
jgi:penicillin-binding protein 1B